MTVDEIVAELEAADPEDRLPLLRGLIRSYPGDDVAFVEPWLEELVITMGGTPLPPLPSEGRNA